MRLSYLVEQLTEKFDTELITEDCITAPAVHTAFVAQVTALDAARAGSIGRGLQLAAEELHELAVLVASQDQHIRLLAASAKAIVTEVHQMFSQIGSDRWSSPDALRQELSPLKESVSLLICDLVRKISSVPQSLSNYEAPQSGDRIQIETLLRQALINGRDRLSAIEMMLEELLSCCEAADDFESLKSLDTDDFDGITRRRLAGLVRDQSLDERIFASDTAR